MPAPIFTPAQVAAIRQQKRDGLLNPGQWARDLGCSRETVARVARGDSYNRLVLVEEPESAASDEAALASLERFRRVAAEIAPQPPQVADLLDQMTKRKGT